MQEYVDIEPGEIRPFAATLRTGLVLLGLAGLAGVLGVGIARGGLPVALGLAVGPPALVFALVCLRKPSVGVLTAFVVGFFLGGLGRIVAGVPFGLTVDVLLTISLVGALFSARKNDLARLNNPLFYLLLVWLGYNVLELINPEAQSREAWFYAVRSFSFIWVAATAVTLLTLYRVCHLNRFVTLWLVCCVVLALWAFKQQYLGMSGFDQRWFDAFGRITHYINGHLRSFSFCSDAGQYGAVMAQVTLYAAIRAMDEPMGGKKLRYAALTGLYFWGYAVAGSRGPLFIIAMGFVLYLILRRNVVLFVVGATLAGGAFGLLKFTKAGQSNYQVQRMRSALDPNDPSLQLRLANQRAFAQYMAGRPFGSGIGTAGDRGKAFQVESELTKRGIDSWYVKIWVETGVIGLTLHAFTLVLVSLLGAHKVSRLKHPRIRSVMTGLLCGYVGILCGNYGNMVFGQYPTNLIMYLSMAFFMIADRLDREALEADRVSPSPTPTP